MYAIIKKGSKQYRVAEDDVIDIDLFDGEIGSKLEFEVLFISTGTESIIGGPLVSGYVVSGELLVHVADAKIESIKYIPGNHRKNIGHRQHYSRVKITHIGKTHQAAHKAH